MFFEDKHKGSNYSITYQHENMHILSHCHKTFELLMVTDGELLTTLHNQERIVHAGEAMLVLPYEIHAYQTPVNSKTVIFVFSADYVSDFYEQYENCILKSPVFPLGSHEVHILQNAAASGIYAVKSVLYLACSLALKGGYQNNYNDDTSIIGSILSYIRHNYTESISMKDMANELGYSYNYMSLCFKKAIGCHFSEFVNRCRLDEAAHLLLCTDLHITEISRLCGFSTIRNFNYAFLQNYHTTPREFRRTSSGTIHFSNTSERPI